jgi:hypothetical protein
MKQNVIFGPPIPIVLPFKVARMAAIVEGARICCTNDGIHTLSGLLGGDIYIIL